MHYILQYSCAVTLYLHLIRTKPPTAQQRNNVIFLRKPNRQGLTVAITILKVLLAQIQQLCGRKHRGKHPIARPEVDKSQNGSCTTMHGGWRVFTDPLSTSTAFSCYSGVIDEII